MQNQLICQFKFVFWIKDFKMDIYGQISAFIRNEEQNKFHSIRYNTVVIILRSCTDTEGHRTKRLLISRQLCRIKITDTNKQVNPSLLDQWIQAVGTEISWLVVTKKAQVQMTLWETGSPNSTIKSWHALHLSINYRLLITFWCHVNTTYWMMLVCKKPFHTHRSWSGTNIFAYSKA